MKKCREISAAILPLKISENWDEWTGNETGNYDNNSYGNEENYNNSEAHCEDTDFIVSYS